MIKKSSVMPLVRTLAVIFLSPVALFAAPLALSATPPALSNPSATAESAHGPEFVGSLDGAATVGAAGNASYVIPIELPAGRRGLMPNLSLNYNSSLGNGMLGLGWVLGGTSKITRCQSTLASDGVARAVRYDEQDRYCLDGNKLLGVSGVYGAGESEYRIEINQFAAIKSHGGIGYGPESFTIKTKGGLTKYYGNTEDSRAEGEGHDAVRTWALNRVEDAAGNYYDFTYFENNPNGRHYVLSASYTGNEPQGLAPRATVDFLYETRSENVAAFEAGTVVKRTSRRLSGIETHLDGSLVSDYRLSYEEVGVDGRPRLVKVERCDNMGVCQTPIDLEWWHDGSVNYTEQTLTVPFFDDDTHPDSPAGLIGYQYNVPRWHDMNGDGRPDYVHVVPESNGWYDDNQLDLQIKLTTPSGYSTETWTLPFGGHPKDFHWADIDGDGRTDVIKVEPYGTAGDIEVALAGVGGFTSEPGYDDRSTDDKQVIIFADMNGDGLLDLVKTIIVKTDCAGTCSPYQISTRVRVFLNNGSGFNNAQTWLPTTTSGKYKLLDFTGNGLIDVILDDRYVYANDGTSFESTGRDFGATPGGFDVMAYGDYNGDGLTDRRVRRADGQCCDTQRSTGEVFEYKGDSDQTPVFGIDDNGINDAITRTSFGGSSTSYGSYSLALPTTTLSMYLARDGSGGSYEEQTKLYASGGLNYFQQSIDINGDGLMDHSLAHTRICDVHNYMAWNGSYYEYWDESSFCEDDKLKILENDGRPTNLLKKVKQGRNVETIFRYKPLTDATIYTKGNNAQFPIFDVQDGKHVVFRLTQSNGIGGNFRVDYSYAGLQRDVQRRRDMGFAEITAVNKTKGTTTVTEYAQTFPYISQPTRVRVMRTSDSRLLREVLTDYQVVGTVGLEAIFPYVSDRAESVYDLGDGRLLSDTTTANSQIDNYGNIGSTIKQVDDYENNQTFKTQTLSSFTVNDSWQLWQVGQLTSRTIKAWEDDVNDPGMDRTTDFTYDSQTGFLTASIQQPGGGVGIELTKSLAYDYYGNVVSETISGPGLASRASTTTYDAYHQFPATLTNALNHTMSQTWDARFGNKTSETDANGKTTSWTYTSFGYPLLETRPDGTTTETRAYEYNAGSLPTAETYLEIVTSGKPRVRQYLDALGREVRSRTRGFQGGYSNVDTEHDTDGRAYRVSEPYFDGATPAWNTSSYDDMGRVTAVSAADPVTSGTITYDGFEVAVTDSLYRTETKGHDARGLPVQVIDKAGTTMVLDYNAVGHRVQVTNAAGSPKQNSVTYNYDRLGRILTQNDPDHGVYTYTYDALGQKLSEVSPVLAAAQQSITFQYDLLGRMTSRTEPEGTTTWMYDNTSNGNLGIGRVYNEYQSGFSRTYSYNSTNFGRLTSTSTVIDANVYVTDRTYNPEGQLATETYPNGFSVEYTYNTLGYLERVRQPGGPAVYYQLVNSDAAGRMTEEWLGDGSLATQNYEGYSSRVTDQHTQNGTTVIQHFNYVYDAAGNMTSRGDVVHGLSESFTFDNLDRLTNAQVASASPVSYDFDVVGNIIEKSDVGNPFLYTSAAVHAVTQITSGASTKNISYDSNGNLSNGDDLPAITWSSYNKPTQLAKGGVTYDFAYGPDRKRYKKERNGYATHYAGGGYEKAIFSFTTTERLVIRANGRAVMVRKVSSGGTAGNEYIHRDHIGSVTAMTRETDGSVIERFSYDAWGKRRGATDWTSVVSSVNEPRGYTGHEHLDDVGVIHMNGRVYSPTLGRMLSPDPVTQAPNNGQNYNRYSYAYNNPLKYSDPSGFIVCEAGCQFVVSSVIASITDVFGFGGNGCDRTCKERHAALRTCNATAACKADIGNVKEKFRRRGAMAILDAIDQGLSWRIENRRVVVEAQVVGAPGPAQQTNGRGAGNVYVTGHRVVVIGPVHTAIEYTDANGKVVTLSAGPDGGSLVSDLNRSSDAPANNFTVDMVTLPKNVTAQDYVNSLIRADSNYCDCIDYDLFPGIADSYNSNSYVHGLLNATGGTTSVNLDNYYGGNDPLPSRYFRSSR